MHGYPHHAYGIQLRETRRRPHGDKMFAAVCQIGLEGIVSKKLDAPYKSGPSKAWLKIKNPKAPPATRAAN
jgi:bifunctional non-homologous end joining protein LigD